MGWPLVILAFWVGSMAGMLVMCLVAANRCEHCDTPDEDPAERHLRLVR